MYATVVLPAHDEQDSIGLLLREIRREIEHLPVREVILVDDGSTDETAKRAVAAWGGDVPLRIIRHGRCLGQSRALLTGIRAASQDLIATLDADGQNDPADLAALFAAYAARQGQFPRLLVAGQRLRRQDSLVRRLSSRMANGIRATLLNDHVRDTGCSLKLFRRQDFLDLPFFDHIHRFIPAMMRASGAAVVLVGVGHRPRKAGRSKYGIWDRLWAGIYDLIGVRWLMKRQVANVEVEDVL